MSDVLFNKSSELQPDDYVAADAFASIHVCDDIACVVGKARDKAQAALSEIAEAKGYLGYINVTETVNLNETFVVVTITGDPVPGDEIRDGA